MPERTWTDEQLAEAVRSNPTLADVMRSLGLKPGRYDLIRAHILRLGLDAEHLKMEGGARRRGGWSFDDLAEAVASSTSYAEVMRRLGYVPSGGVHRWLKARIRSLGLSTTHFTGQATGKGARLRGRGLPLEEVLVAGSTYTTGNLRRRLLKEGRLPAECAECGRVEWRGRPITLMLDHINGDPTDHRFENLRLLCPNCHSQTPTWCNRKRDAS